MKYNGMFGSLLTTGELGVTVHFGYPTINNKIE
jgi:hypothetical protein